ncbi:MAG: hypothetical protein ACK4WH_07865 [Phycisphaerales bacterium]
MDVASVVLILIGAYAGSGLLFALVFVAIGAERIDPGAAGSGIALRAMIAPGAAALWPWLLRKWLRAARSAPGESEP